MLQDNGGRDITAGSRLGLVVCAVVRIAVRIVVVMTVRMVILMSRLRVLRVLRRKAGMIH